MSERTGSLGTWNSYCYDKDMNLQRFQKEPRLKVDGYRLRDKGDFAGAAKALSSYVSTHPKDLIAALDLGHCYMQLERFEDATKVYAKILERDPKNVIALSNLGGSLYRSGKPRDAKTILEYALELDPKCLYAHINMGGVLQALGDQKGNLDSALAAVSIEPTSALAFNNLGSALSELAMFQEAKHAYETAALLQPDQVDTLINLAAVEARLGSAEKSIEMYERTLKLLPAREKHRADAVRFYCSFEYLKMGNLEKGWEYYDGGFSPMVPIAGSRTPKRTFNVPLWDGQSLEGKRLLVWREQGLGDELLFGSCLPDLRTLACEKVIVECDPRLVGIFSRSFPDYLVRAQAYSASNGMSPFEDFDYHLPFGSLMRQFRKSIDDFSKSGPYLVASEEMVADFQIRFAQYRDKPLVGICWRSGKLSPVRNLSYTVLEDWRPILESGKVNIVSLQYGEAEAEIVEAEKKLGVKIIRWQDLDQKNELDRVFALMSCLDWAISVNTAPLRMASAIGLPVVSVEGRSWAQLGTCQRNSVWFNNNLQIEASGAEGLRSSMPALLAILEEFSS